MQITLRSPLDMHLHLREGPMLKTVAPYSCQYFAGAVIMPNLVSPVDSLAKVGSYRSQIIDACGDHSFTPYMTMFCKPYSRDELVQVKGEILGIKLYPAGITTRSENGVSDFKLIEETLSYMEELHIPLLVHGETHGYVMDREMEFIGIYRRLAENFPRLHIVMEHITTAAAVEFLERFDNVSATITLHHLMITLDDVIGNLLEPDLFCKPIAKTPRDLECLRSAVFSGHPRIMFGSDSAPHPRHKKECCGCAAGIFSTPAALPMLAELFEDAGRLELLQNFVNGIACDRYGLLPPDKSITLEQKPWTVPERCSGLVPFGAGRTLRWSVACDTQ
ncbi:MAG: dihydroorotase [Desulforhopalus sp.]